jgi:hypothetical protein
VSEERARKRQQESEPDADGHPLMLLKKRFQRISSFNVELSGHMFERIMF